MASVCAFSAAVSESFVSGVPACPKTPKSSVQSQVFQGISFSKFSKVSFPKFGNVDSGRERPLHVGYATL